MAKLLTEFVGTMFLALVSLLTHDPIAIAGVLTAMVYMGGAVSGAHFNPAVTLAFALRSRITWKEAARYGLAQLLGAMFAAGVSWCLLNETNTIAPSLAKGPHHWYLSEIVFTFALCLVYFHVADGDATRGNSHFGIAIGFVAGAGAYAVGRISGGAFNPAVGIGPDLVSLLNDATVPGGAWLLYLVGPSIGAILAVLAFTVQRAR